MKEVQLILFEEVEDRPDQNIGDNLHGQNGYHKQNGASFQDQVATKEANENGGQHKVLKKQKPYAQCFQHKQF
ncbi:MAG: hypothetical protein AABY93_04390 [Bacteroidota bacterium]